MSPQLTPVELRDGIWFKREDAHRLAPSGVNGAKLRACQHLIGTAARHGATGVISAASVLSPQNAMAAVVARSYGLPCTVILGGTRPDAARRHPSVRIAAGAGARFEYAPVGYNPALQKAASRIHAADPGAYWLRYGITPPGDASIAELRAFHAVGADQVANLPDAVRTLVIPFGSGNTAVGVLVGLARRRPAALERVVLAAIGPDRRAWLRERLALLGVEAPVPLEYLDLHGSGYAKYGDAMPHRLAGIDLHPTYEGKIGRYLDERRPEWWTSEDASTCLWIVGGPLPRAATGAA